MKQRSAGLLLYRWRGAAPEFFLVHPGGPFWAKKDNGAWSIPKGLYNDGEEPLAAAKREFQEETGFPIGGEFVPLGEFPQPSRKIISAWMVKADLDADKISSNSFSMEWPPKSGRMADFPEVDRAAWFAPAEACVKILRGQKPMVEAVLARLVSGQTHPS